MNKLSRIQLSILRLAQAFEELKAAIDAGDQRAIGAKINAMCRALKACEEAAS